MALVRLQKLISERGVASRRKAEELIEQGKVKVNGRVAKLGDKADDRKDIVTVCGKKLERAEMPVYLMLNKPRGYVTTLKDEQGRKCVADLVESTGARIYPVGRLDRDSEGLLLMTNDGDFANAITHPSRHLAKVYRVTLRGQVSEEQLEIFGKGVVIDGRRTAPAEVVIVLSTPERTVIEVILHEGRNRQIRRTCEEAGLEVIRLRRTAIGPVRMGMLKIGDWRHLTPEEVRNLLMETATTKKIAASYIKNGKAVIYDRNKMRRG